MTEESKKLVEQEVEQTELKEQPKPEPENLLNSLIAEIVKQCNGGKVRSVTAILAYEDASVHVVSTGSIFDIKTSIALAEKKLP